MNKRIIALLLVIGLIFTGLPINVFAEAKISAKLISMEGEVQVLRAGGEKPFNAFKNMRLTEGDRIITGSNGKAKIEMDDEVVITLTEDTKIYISELRGSSGAKQSSVNLQSGGVGSSVKKKLPDNSRFEIKTPTAVMGVRGTEFFTQYRSGNVDLRVVDGAVEVRVNVDSLGEVTGIGAGQGEEESFIVEALKQVEFTEGEKVEEVRTKVETIKLEGLPEVFLERVEEIIKEDPLALPEEIIETIEEAVKEAVKKREEKAKNPNIVPDEMAEVEEEIEGQQLASAPDYNPPAPPRPEPEPTPPSTGGGGGTTTPVVPGPGEGTEDPEEPEEPEEPEVEFKVEHYIGYNEETYEYEYEKIEDNQTIKYYMQASVENGYPGYDWIDLRLSSEIEGIDYQIVSSNETVAQVVYGVDVGISSTIGFRPFAATEGFNPIIGGESDSGEGKVIEIGERLVDYVGLNIMGLGETEITITGKADGFKERTMKFILEVGTFLEYEGSEITKISNNKVMYDTDMGGFSIPYDVTEFTFMEGESTIGVIFYESDNWWDIIESEDVDRDEENTDKSFIVDASYTIESNTKLSIEVEFNSEVYGLGCIGNDCSSISLTIKDDMVYDYNGDKDEISIYANQTKPNKSHKMELVLKDAELTNKIVKLIDLSSIGIYITEGDHKSGKIYGGFVIYFGENGEFDYGIVTIL